MKLLEKVINQLGRAIEYALTGQSGFQLTLSEFTTSPSVDSSVQARLVLDEVQETLAGAFSIQVCWPVLLELKRPPAFSWKASFYHSEGNLGRYTPGDLGEKRSHQIMVVPGLPRGRFRAILGHELVHAYQREQNLLAGNPALREGMARWVEYHLLRQADAPAAEKLLQIRHYTFGKAVQTIVEYEQKRGIPETLRWLRELDRS